jgi:outer membrane protein, multidrug efflux system
MKAFQAICLGIGPDRLPSTLAALALVSMLAACSTAPTKPHATIEVPAVYKEAAAVQMGWTTAQLAEAQPPGQWWRAFRDPSLDKLQQQAEAGSPRLGVATARVRAARALLQGAEADRMPQVGLQAGTGRQGLSAVEAGQANGTQVPPVTTWQVGVGASYEIDLFQRVAHGVQAAKAEALASEALLRSVRLDLQANVAQAYYQLRTLDAEVDLLTRALALRDQTLGLIDKRHAAGGVAELDLTRARAERASALADLQGVQGLRRNAEHALALLLGQTPAAFQLTPQPLAADLAVPQVPAGLPSALLQRRPDVTAAQARMAAATARVSQARSALFPALALTAQGGQASSALSDLFATNARTWLVSMVANLPLIDGGRNRAAITRAEATLDESVADYRQAVLQAFGDVEGQLASLGSARAQVESLDEALVAARRSTELADKRYRAGEDSYLTLLETQRNLLSIERQSVQLRGSWVIRTVGLVRALGGGW